MHSINVFLNTINPGVRKEFDMKKVAIVMGSDSDLGVMRPAAKRLEYFGIPYEMRIISAHRTPDACAAFSKAAQNSGFGVIIAAAGKAAHLAGVIASGTTLPVIGVPIKSSTLDGMDSLLSTVQMPKGIPVATVAIDGAENAAILAAQILALSDREIANKLEEFREEMTREVAAKDALLCRNLADEGILQSDLPIPNDKPKEECGVFGISLSPSDSYRTADETYLALFALQHRGQESCGIATSHEGVIHVVKRSGLVSEVFDEQTLHSLQGKMAIGHVRYASSSEASAINAQPIAVTHINGSMAIACNGSLVNGAQLRHQAEMSGAIFQTTNDTEVIAYMLVRERLKTPVMEDAICNIMDYVDGAYSMVILSGNKLIAARDPFGFRPLCMGKLGSSVVFASESCAFDAIGAEFVRDIEPGEIVVTEDGRVTKTLCARRTEKPSLCVFEFVYFARPDTVIGSLTVEHVRQNFGKALAKRDTTEADIVIGVPDSGLSSALGYSKESGIPYGVGLVKNQYIGRTFIRNTRSEREKAVSIKLSALKSVVKGKRVIMVDDSIVRGTTCSHIVSLLRAAGALEVHVRISCPPFLHRCYYGTHVPHESDLAAHNRTVEQISDMIGADSLMFLELEDLSDALSHLRSGYCDSCFTGIYPVSADPVSEQQFERRIQV